MKTVPVKLLRPENTLRKANADRMYAKCSVDDVQRICSLFGPDAVLFLSNDDKARVPLGLAAANLQAPILMHLDYKVRLNDHSFVVGARHNLIPSVYAVCEVTPNGDLSYSGDTFIRVRSGKHDSSTAFTHAYDLRELFLKGCLPEKPILLMETDGAPDEAPRFPKPLSTAVSLFKQMKFDALIHVVNAAGLSAFNPVERRMAPLSHDLAGLILPHDHYGTHLNSSGKTMDEELEEKNFLAAAEALSEVWSNTVIDSHKVECETVPIGKEFVPDDPNPSWIANHVQQARYCLQVVKCTNPNCCEPFSTNWLDVFPERFLPGPAIYEYTTRGIEAVKPSEYFKDPKKFMFSNLEKRLVVKKLPTLAKEFEKKCPFDLYCPSMQEKLKNCVCRMCGSYWPSEAAKKRHIKCHSLKESSVPCQDEASNYCEADHQIDRDGILVEEGIDDSPSHTVELSIDAISESQ